MQVILFSFGYKHGRPEADTVLDIRFLPNPFYVPSLMRKTGLERETAAYVMENDIAREFLPVLEQFMTVFLHMHRSADKTEIRIAVGCTGGRHRSVAVVEHLKDYLGFHSFDVHLYHRDIDKE